MCALLQQRKVRASHQTVRQALQVRGEEATALHAERTVAQQDGGHHESSSYLGSITQLYLYSTFKKPQAAGVQHDVIYETTHALGTEAWRDLPEFHAHPHTCGFCLISVSQEIKH